MKRRHLPTYLLLLAVAVPQFCLCADEQILFDTPRHKTTMKPPLDWPRINQFPEWFTVKSDTNYGVHDMTTEKKKSYTGKAMHEGLQVSLKAGVVKQIRIKQQ